MSTVITASMVNELRQRTGAGMMECKKALVAVNGDMDEAEKEIAKSGSRKAEKNASRTAAEGTIAFASGSGTGALLEVNCETDFVGRDASFLDYAKQVAELVLSSGETEMSAIKAMTFPGSSETVEQTRAALVGKIGENIQLRRASHLKAPANGHLGVYMHGSKIGVLVSIAGGDAALAKDVAMHVAASRPEFLSPDKVPSARVDREKELLIAASSESGKPKEIIEKMVQGRLNKYFAELCLIGQPFIKNPDQTVAQLLKEKNASVENFIRFEVGEGIEKKAEASFADEVAQMSGAK